MPDIFSSLDKFKFDGITFPVISYRFQGGQRKKVHSYPHVNAGKAEKLGRELYTLHVQAIFDTSMDGVYPNNYPHELNNLLQKFEDGKTGYLTVPTRGTMKAFCDDWTVDMSAIVRNGERAEFSFVEDDEAGFVLHAFANIMNLDLLSSQLSLAEMRKLYEADMSAADKSIFDKIDNAINKVRAVMGFVETNGMLVISKAERLVGLCQEMEGLAEIIKNPRAYPLYDASLQLWYSATQIVSDVKNLVATPIKTFTVPMMMGLAQLSAAIYAGDATRGRDLLGINFFEDAYAIPAGTVVRYYPDD